MKKISYVVPIYNESKNIIMFFERLHAVFGGIPNYEYEVIFVNDGSVDESKDILMKLANEYSYIKVINFSKNFGKEVALSAGMHAAKGDVSITIDADLQQPPEIIPELIKRWESGDDIVICVRQSHKGESVIKQLGTYIFYFILKHISDTNIVPYTTDFRLVSRQVLNVFALCEERDRMTRGLIDWLGFKKSYVSYESGLRKGKPSYGTLKLIRLAMIGFVKNSLFPLKFVGYLGLLLTIFSSLIGLVVFLNKYIFQGGWGANFSAVDIISIILVFMMGIMLVCMGILALYIADIQVEVRRRPLYIIKDTKNI